MRELREMRFFGFVALCALCVLAGVGCGGGGGGGGLFGDDLTTDPDALLAAEVGGNASAGLEIVLLGAGLLTEIPLGMIPADAVQVMEEALNELLESCLTAESITGDTTGLSVAFAQGGCGLSNTNINLQGGFSFQTSSTDSSSAWAVEFISFEVGGVAVDGGIAIEVMSGSGLDFEIADLDVDYGSDPIKVDATGSLTTNDAHTDITFSGQGAVTFKSTTYAVTLTDIERHATTDCYPETGSIGVTITRADGTSYSASLEFEDDALGLDTDDTGQVRVTLNGEEHTALLPERLCTGF